MPLQFTADLEEYTGLMFNKAKPIRPSRGFDQTHAERFLTASEDLLRRALG